MTELATRSIEETPHLSSHALGAVAVEQTASSHNSWEARAHEIEHIVDPNHTLPTIELRSDPDFEKEHKAFVSQGYTKNLAYDETGKEVGRISTKPSEHTDGMTEIVYVHTDRRGEGYGMAMYLKEIMVNVSQGKGLTNDPTGVSESAKKVWEKLHKLGVAVEREPFVPSDLSPGAYRGRYDVI